jgi:Spy/CpxP family protein refolding chaperone
MMLDRAREAVDLLRLTPEQKAKVDTIFKEARAELEQMKSQLESMEMRDRLAEVREFFDGVRADLALVLTPEQRQQIEQRFERIRNAVAAGPDGGAGPGGAMPPGMLAERLRDAIPKLKLSDEQARKVKELFDDIRPRGEALRQQVEMGDAAAREKMRELGQETRTKIREILTPEQQEKLRELMTQPPPQGGPRGRRPGGAATRAAAAGPDKSDQMMSGDTMMSGGAGDTMMKGAAAGRTARKPPSPGVPNESERTSAGPAVGDAAPDFTLTKIDGAQVNLASMKGRVIVLVFGSYSAPTFRNRAAAMEKLRSDFGTRATFFVVYSREAHPTGEWEVSRNKQDGISVEQARSVESRKSAATTARDKLKITTPILLDTLGNDTALAYGAGINSAYIIGRDGTIAARQQWFEPLALRRALDAATAAKPATKPAP